MVFLVVARKSHLLFEDVLVPFVIVMENGRSTSFCYRDHFEILGVSVSPIVVSDF